MQSRVNDALLADWCLRYLGAPFERVLFRSGFLSEVVGVELPGGLRAVVKTRPFQPRIAACLQVQAALARPLRGSPRSPDRFGTRPGGCPRSGALAAVDGTGPSRAGTVA